MRITRQHVFTSEAQARTADKNSNKLGKTFQKGAPINMSSRPLADRVSMSKKFEKQGKSLSKQASAIIRNIPTPFLIKKR